MKKKVFGFVGLFLGGALVSFMVVMLLGVLGQRHMSELIDEAKSLANISEVPGKLVVTESNEVETNPYWQFVQANLMKVDFSKLSEKNSDTVGWLQVMGTEVSVPFVQTDNNEYYLGRTFDKGRNAAGWVFLDSRNKNGLSDRENIIYIPGGENAEVFAVLSELLNNGWLTDRANFLVRTASTTGPSANWQIFSIYRTDDISHLATKFGTDAEFFEFISEELTKSEYGFSVPVSAADKVVTLVVRGGKTPYAVIHAKKIKES